MDSNPIRPSEPQPLDAAPLNSLPYVDPITSTCLAYEVQNQRDTKHADMYKPDFIYLPSRPTDEELHNILSVTNCGIGLSGSAVGGTMGPLLGKMDIGESEDSYIFRVSLPGVAREEFTCDVTPNGQILIKGVTTTGEKIVYKHCLKFEMLSQNLCPPGLFSIEFKLPGPVDSQHLSAHFGVDGVFEGIVKKKTVVY